jgi:hypothetical protein
VKLDRDRRSLIKRQSVERERGLMRCPACYAVKDHLLKGFACSLSRCPRVFVNIQPPAASQPAGVRAGPEAERSVPMVRS